jgi:hypothetical protein
VSAASLNGYHVEDLFAGPQGRLFQVLDWSGFPRRLDGKEWLTFCPLHPGEPDALRVTSEHADDVGLRCEHGCDEDNIRARLREIELLALESLGPLG